MSVEKKAFPTGGMDKGMDLRDYFAAKAMQSIIHRYEGKGFGGNSESPEFVNVAEQAYFMADAMIEARSK